MRSQKKPAKINLLHLS